MYIAIGRRQPINETLRREDRRRNFDIPLVVATACAEELLSNFSWTKNIFMMDAFVLCVTFALSNIIKEVLMWFLLMGSMLFRSTFSTLLFSLPLLTFTVLLSSTWWLLSYSLPFQASALLHLFPIVPPKKTNQSSVHYFFFRIQVHVFKTYCRRTVYAGFAA